MNYGKTPKYTEKGNSRTASIFICHCLDNKNKKVFFQAEAGVRSRRSGRLSARKPMLCKRNENGP